MKKFICIIILCDLPSLKSEVVSSKDHQKRGYVTHYLQLLDLWFQLAALVAGNWASNHGSCHPTSSSKSLFWRNKDVWNILPSQETIKPSFSRNRNHFDNLKQSTICVTIVLVGISCFVKYIMSFKKKNIYLFLRINYDVNFMKNFAARSIKIHN